ncbi:LOW QUALITY PROTEIN: hypothetical protein Cgig2_003048 [Carnegiea gigantea]|uniref:RNase H type-1 domain-containing protein n=1 Tax=Carnegiea gigantea TaxID=171969 RepID=A0A9Q1JSQ5_9CARY|nr:LOW QUALITY PROTEIN: hypothetical protein Cgig2_003048 [Carnegiea gigantea]
MWECRNSRNRFIFGKKEGNRAGLCARAVVFVHHFRRIREDDTPAPTTSATTHWMPSSLGLFKLNFDVGKDGRGWGFVVRDNTGEVMVAGVTQDEGFLSPEVEESRACLFTLKTATAHGFKRLVVKGDSLALTIFDFVSWNFVKRGCNSIAHAIAHLHPINFCERTWKDGMPDIVYDLAAKDMCTYLDNQSI